VSDTLEQNKSSKNVKEVDLKPLYARSVINSLSAGMVNPFMGAYAVKLGASSSDMGWFQSSSNLSNNIMQVLWGRLSDRLKRRIPFIVLGGLIVSTVYVPMIFVTRAYQLIILLAVQALLGSMSIPTWAALIGDLVPSAKLGRANASINLWVSIGGLVATLMSGILMIIIGGTFQEMLFIPLTVATVFGIISALVMLRIKEKKNHEKLDLKRRIASDMFGLLKQAKKSPEFVKYCYVEGFFEFFMSMAWPLISITQVTVLNASVLQLALLSVVQTFFTIIFQGWAGRRTDVLGRKPLLVFFRFALITVPIAYALSPNIDVLIVISVFWGIAFALGQASMFAYLLDIAPEEYRGGFIAVFNLVIGVTTFFGSLVAGYLSNYLIALFGLVTGLQIVYLISTIGRTIGATLYLTLKETLKK